MTIDVRVRERAVTYDPGGSVGNAPSTSGEGFGCPREIAISIFVENRSILGMNVELKERSPQYFGMDRDCPFAKFIYSPKFVNWKEGNFI